MGAGVTALFPCSEQCGVSTKLSLSTKPPPGLGAIEFGALFGYDGQVLDQLKCLYGCGVEAPLALEVRACHMGRVAVGCRAVRW